MARGIKIFSLIFALALIAAAPAFGGGEVSNGKTHAKGGEVSNGGSAVKIKFIEVSEQFYRRLKAHALEKFQFPTDREWTLDYQGQLLPLSRIPWVLHERNLEVVAGPLFDNNGSKVGARAVEGSPVSPLIRKVQLDESAWLGLFKHPEVLDKLVCHELMRAIRVNDDDMKVCEHLVTLQAKELAPITPGERLPHESAATDSSTAPDAGSEDKADSEADTVDSRIVPRRKTSWSVLDFAESLPRITSQGPLEITARAIELAPARTAQLDLDPAQVKNRALFELKASRIRSSWALKRTDSDLNSPRVLPESDALSESEARCLEKQVNALNSLRDASISSPDALAFRELMAQAHIQYFDLVMEILPEAGIPLPEGSALVEARDSGRRTNVLGMSKAIYDYSLSSSYRRTGLHLAAGPERPDYEPFKSDTLRKLEIRFSMQGEDCGTIEAPQLLDRLNKLVFGLKQPK